jgi:hypothetical protein
MKRRIVLYCVIGILIGVLFLFLLPALKCSNTKEGATSAEDVLQIIDADLCYKDKCLSSDAQAKMLHELNTSIYDNNIDVKAIDLKVLGLSEADISFNVENLEDAVFSIQYQYGALKSGSGSHIHDLSFNGGAPMNLANYKYGPLVIQEASYCYTDSSGGIGVSQELGKQYCIPESDNLVGKLNSMISNNTLNIKNVNPLTLGNVSNPYSLVPNSKLMQSSSANQFDISYAYGTNATVNYTSFDGSPFSTRFPSAYY